MHNPHRPKKEALEGFPGNEASLLLEFGGDALKPIQRESGLVPYDNYSGFNFAKVLPLLQL